MSNLSPIGSGLSTAPLGLTARRNDSAASQPAADTNPSIRLTDSVTLSEHARYLEALESGDDTRVDLINRVKGEIADGSYLSDERLDLAIDALARDLLA